MGTEYEDVLSSFVKFRLTPEGNVQRCSSRFYDTLGYSEQELNDQIFTKLVHEDDQEVWKDLINEIQRGDQNDTDSQLRLKKKTGETVEVLIDAILVRDATGSPAHILCTLVDLAEQVEVLRKLKEREQQFESLFKHNPHPVYYFDLEGNFEGVNDKLVEFTGYSRDELIGMSYKNFIVEEDLERTRKQFKKAANGEAGQYEISVKIKDGGIRDIRVTKFPRIEGNEITGVFGILQDITKEKIAKRKLEKSEQRWHQLVEQNPQPVQIVQDGKIAFINQSGADYYGASSPKELVGKSILDFAHPDNMENALKRKYALENDQEVEPDEHKVVLLNGEERYIEAHSIPIIYKDKKAIQTVLHDITDLKEKQNKIGKSLKQKETLLQEIHHRVKNNLAMISSLLELQIMQSTQEAAKNVLRDSQLRIRSMAMIHEKLYQNDSLYDIDFDEYLEELVQTIQKTYSSVGQQVETVFELDHVLLDINQVIPCSLIVNEVVVNCYKHGFAKHGNGRIRITLNYDDPELKLEITDNGNGLPDDFNINELQSLGMTLIQTLSEQLNGNVEFSEAENGGTVFKLKFERKSAKL